MQPVTPTPELYRQLFEVDVRGQAILEHLTQLFCKGAVTSGGIDAVLQTFHRQGAQSVVNHILQQINQANNVPTTGDQDDGPQAQFAPSAE